MMGFLFVNPSYMCFVYTLYVCHLGGKDTQHTPNYADFKVARVGLCGKFIQMTTPPKTFKD